MNQFSIDIKEDKAYIKTPYNPDFVDRIKLSGNAKWDPTTSCWVVPAYMVNQVRELMLDVYGMSDEETGEIVELKLTFDKFVEKDLAPIIMFGKILSNARGRDSGAKAGNDVMYVEGGPYSGGSRKTWSSGVDEGSVVHLYNVSKAIYDKQINDLPEGVHAELIDNGIDIESLKEERDRLQKRLIEIEQLLATTH